MSWLSKAYKKVRHVVSDTVGAIIPHVSAAEKRAQMHATKSQIDYYNQAKEELNRTRADTEERKNQERKRIGEKELRSRQRVYRRSGFLSEPNQGPTDKLG